MADKIILAMPIAAAVFILISYYLLNTVTVAAMPPASFTVGNSTYAFTSYALNESQAEKGLMNASVGNNTFMLFVFNSSSIYSFWMKDTYTQLDIIWVNAKNSTGRIVYIVNASPCVNYSANQTNCPIYTPKGNANYVIETHSGFVNKNHLAIGNTIKFNSN